MRQSEDQIRPLREERWPWRPMEASQSHSNGLLDGGKRWSTALTYPTMPRSCRPRASLRCPPSAGTADACFARGLPDEGLRIFFAGAFADVVPLEPHRCLNISANGASQSPTPSRDGSLATGLADNSGIALLAIVTADSGVLGTTGRGRLRKVKDRHGVRVQQWRFIAASSIAKGYLHT